MVRPGRPGRLSAVRQERGRRRPGGRRGLARVPDQADPGRGGVQRGVARPDGPPGRDERTAGRFGVVVRDRRCRRARDRDSTVCVGPPVPGGAAGCAARADRGVAAADAGPVRPDDAGTSRPRGRRCCSAATGRRRSCGTTSPTRAAWSGSIEMLEFCSKYGHDPLAEVGEQHGPGQHGPDSAGRRSCRSPTSSGGRYSPCPTSAPTSIRRM